MNSTFQNAVCTMVTVSALTTITSARAALVGVVFCGSGTARLQIFHGVTASVAATVTVIASRTAAAATANSAVYFPLAGEVSGGMTVDLQSTGDPRLMLYWVPMG